MGPDGRIRVLWLSKGLGQGGMERLLVTHARLGDRDRFEYRAAYLVDRPHSVVEELEQLDVPVQRLGPGPAWPLQILSLVRREGIDVVHVHSPSVAAEVRPLLRLGCPRVRLVYTEHNRWNRYARPTRIANRATYALDHRTLAVSDDCRSSVTPRLRRSVRTLTHGIDVPAVAAHRADRDEARRELGLAADALLVGTVANLRVQKNYPLLLRVAAEVTAARPCVRFIAVGQGPLEHDLGRLHDDLGLDDRFRFLGFRSDVHRVMSAFDLFCLSSDHEGLPVAVMEAKALGLPVVATDVGGLREAVTDGVDGRLVPAGDGAALARALLELVDDPVARTRMGHATRNTADRFGAQRAVDAIESTYAEVLR